MIPTPAAIDIPLRTDEDGVIRIGNTRITLQTIVAAYQRGDTPEEIMEGFPSLKLADIHALISYYLSYQPEVDDYVRQQDAQVKQIKSDIEQNHPEMLHGQAKFRALLDEKKSD